MQWSSGVPSRIGLLIDTFKYKIQWRICDHAGFTTCCWNAHLAISSWGQWVEGKSSPSIFAECRWKPKYNLHAWLIRLWWVGKISLQMGFWVMFIIKIENLMFYEIWHDDVRWPFIIIQIQIPLLIWVVCMH